LSGSELGKGSLEGSLEQEVGARELAELQRH
jgi:hypothetical protein